MKRALLLFSIVLAGILCLAGTGLAQTQTGVVQGKVVDQQGGVLPGVNVDLIGPMGAKSTVTDAQGEFRFVGVAPGTYSVKVDLSGFLAQQLRGDRRRPRQDRRAELRPEGRRAVRDGRSLGVGAQRRRQELLHRHEPQQRHAERRCRSTSSTSTGLLNYAPGINSDSAYGGQGTYGNALLLDGVDTRDPAGRLGLDVLQPEPDRGNPDRRPGRGGRVRRVHRRDHQHDHQVRRQLVLGPVLDALHERGPRRRTTSPTRCSKANPSLGDADVIKKLVDYTVQMGGPIVKDKAFFFGSVQRYSCRRRPDRAAHDAHRRQPAVQLQADLPADAERYAHVRHAVRPVQRDGPRRLVADGPDDRQRDGRRGRAEWVWNAQYRKVFGTSTLLEAKFTGYTGYYYLDPVDPAPPVYDGETGEYSGGGGGIYYADRAGTRLIVSVYQVRPGVRRATRFKFGAEIERSHVRSQYQPYGPGWLLHLRLRRRAVLPVQLRVRPPGRQPPHVGLRAGPVERRPPHAEPRPPAGSHPRLQPGARSRRSTRRMPPGARASAQPSTSPATGTTVLKGFWGRYFEGAATAFFTSATPGIAGLHVDTRFCRTASSVRPRCSTPASGVRHQRGHQPSADRRGQRSPGSSRLFGNMRFVATGIWRTTANFVNNVIEAPSGARSRRPTRSRTSRPRGYYWENRVDHGRELHDPQHQGLSSTRRSTEARSTRSIRSATYKALMLLLSRPLKNRWGFQASYVLVQGRRQRQQQRVRQLGRRKRVGVAEHRLSQQRTAS